MPFVTGKRRARIVATNIAILWAPIPLEGGGDHYGWSSTGREAEIRFLPFSLAW